MADMGDPLLFEAGYTLVWVGWEFDVPDRTGMKLYAPVIQGHHGAGAVGNHCGSRRRQRHPWAIARRSATRLPTQSSATMTVRDKPTEKAQR